MGLGTIEQHNRLLAKLRANYAAYHILPAGPNLTILAKLREAYDLNLRALYNKSRSLWNERLGKDYSVLMGGDALHLSHTYREEQVTSWLTWVLEAPPLDTVVRNNFLSNLFTQLGNTNDYKFYSGLEADTSVLISGGVSFENEEWVSRDRKLDLVIRSGTANIVIENKIGDMGLSKNIDYRTHIEKWGNTWPFLLLPREDLQKYLEEHAGDSRKSNAVLKAFPPITWEEMLDALRKCAKAITSKNKEVLLWEANLYSFIGFVEGNILKYDLRAVRKVINGEKGNSGDISEIRRYMEYRMRGG